MTRRLASLAFLALLIVPAKFESIALLMGYMSFVFLAFGLAYICWTCPLWKDNQQ